MNLDLKVILGDVCQYCGNESEVTDSKIIYRRSHGNICYCDNCGSYVGLDNSGKPHGRLLNEEGRIVKANAKLFFDQLVNKKIIRQNCTKSEAINAAYDWLSEKMQRNRIYTKLDYFSELECMQVVGHCLPYVNLPAPFIDLANWSFFLSDDFYKSKREEIEFGGWKSIGEILRGGKGLKIDDGKKERIIIPRAVSLSGYVQFTFSSAN